MRIAAATGEDGTAEAIVRARFWATGVAAWVERTLGVVRVRVV